MEYGLETSKLVLYLLYTFPKISSYELYHVTFITWNFLNFLKNTSSLEKLPLQKLVKSAKQWHLKKWWPLESEVIFSIIRKPYNYLKSRLKACPMYQLKMKILSNTVFCTAFLPTKISMDLQQLKEKWLNTKHSHTYHWLKKHNPLFKKEETFRRTHFNYINNAFSYIIHSLPQISSE